MNDLPDPDTLRERFDADEFSRRDVIVGLGTGAVTGWGLWELLPIPWGVDSLLSSAEGRFNNLATRIDSTNLRDPLQIDSLLRDVDATITEVKSILDRETLDNGEQIAGYQLALNQVFGALPGISDPPAKSWTANRVDTLETVLAYYQALRKPLRGTRSTRAILSEYETPILYQRERPDVTLADEINIGRIREEITSTKTVAERTSSGPHVGALLPDVVNVATQMKVQIRVYENHIQSLQAYLSSGEQMEAGARSYERAQVIDAKQQFTTATNAISTSIPESNLSYAISARGPTLSDYRSLFLRRQQAFGHLLDACDDDLTESEQRAKFNEGLNHLLEARRIVA